MILKIVIYAYVIYFISRKIKHLINGNTHSTHQQSNQKTSDVSNLSQAYQVLGCSQDVSDDELKKVYRDLAKKYHPDTIASKDVPDDFVDYATERFQEIQKAYEMVCKERGI